MIDENDYYNVKKELYELELQLRSLEEDISGLHEDARYTFDSIDKTLDNLKETVTRLLDLHSGESIARAYELLGPFSKKQIFYSEKYNICCPDLACIALYPIGTYSKNMEPLYSVSVVRNIIGDLTTLPPLTIKEIKNFIVSFSSISAKKLFIETLK